MWELDYKESWMPKNLCFQTRVLEKTLESPLDCKEILPVHPKGDQSWIFIGRTDAKAETPILWPPDVKDWLIWKHPDAGKDWRWEEKGMIEDEMAGWYHWLDGHEFVWTPGVGDGQGGLVCCSPWGRKEPDTSEWLNWCFPFLDLKHSFQGSGNTFSMNLLFHTSIPHRCYGLHKFYLRVWSQVQKVVNKFKKKQEPLHAGTATVSVEGLHQCTDAASFQRDEYDCYYLSTTTASGGQCVPESEPIDMITVNLATTLKMCDFSPHTIK